MPAAPPKIPAGQFQSVCDAIGDTFTFSQLDAIIYRCFAEHKINDYAGPDLPRRQVATACLTHLEMEGLQVIFLANVLVMVPPDSAAFKTIVMALPEAQSAIPELRTELPDVLAGLAQARHRIADPAAKAALRGYRRTIEDVGQGIVLLDCYKSLHDCLHTIQIRQFAALLASVRKVSTDDEQMDYLREYQDQVRAAIALAQTVVQRLPSQGARRPIEEKWIGELDQAVKFYRKGLEEHNSGAAKIGVIKMSIVLKFQSPRLNDLIAAAAKDLPLANLREVLGTLSHQDPVHSPELAAAADALGKVETALKGRVAEHDMWQSVDKGIWYLDELFGQSADPTEDFTGFWPEVRQPARTLADMSPGAEWASSIADSATRIDEEILRLDAAKNIAPPVKSMLAGIFAGFRSDARHRFFAVDQLLKQDCTLLIDIEAPIAGILEELGDE
jgi:hypothetical protein